MINKKIIFSLLLLFSSQQLLPSEQLPLDQIPEKYLLGGILTVSVGAVLLRKSPNLWQCCTSFINNFLPSKEDLLTSAIASKNTKMVAQLLVDPTIDINKKIGLWPPLKMAVELENKEIVKLLLARPDIDVNNESPLRSAVNKNYINMVKLLLANSNIIIDNSYQISIIRFAARIQDIEIVQLLANHISSFNLKILLKFDGLYSRAISKVLSKIAKINWSTIQSLYEHQQITDEQFIYFFPEEVMHTNKDVLISFAEQKAMKEEDNTFFIDWNSQKNVVRNYPLAHSSFVDFCITSKGNLNNRNKDKLRPFDIMNKWYLLEKNPDKKKEKLYYRLLQATPALSCQALFNGFTEQCGKDIAGKLVKLYINLKLPQLPSETLNQKIHALQTNFNKKPSTLLLTTK